jgi:hypothetical protein
MSDSTPLQILLLEICDPKQQPHRFMDAPIGLAKALMKALRQETLCLCERCSADAWSADPYYPTSCRGCAQGEHL